MNTVRSSKKTHFTITKINRLMLFKEIIPVYTKNHVKHINIALLIVNIDGIYIYHSALKG
jgi:hypothetical protein